jgi:hypothetical protein
MFGGRVLNKLDNEECIVQLYDCFVKKKMIDIKYISRNEFKIALQHGHRRYGTKSWSRYVEKSFKHKNKIHDIHTGTFMYINFLTCEKIADADMAHQIAIKDAMSRQKTFRLAKISETQAALNLHKMQLTTLNLELISLNENIVILNNQRDKDIINIDRLNDEINILGASLTVDNASNNDLVCYIMTLQMRLQETQTLLIERLTRVEQLLNRRIECDCMITNIHTVINNLTQVLESIV